MRYDDYGNVLFGGVGDAFGISKDWLLLGANVNQIFKFSEVSGMDDIRDQYGILRGIHLYRTRGRDTYNHNMFKKNR